MTSDSGPRLALLIVRLASGLVVEHRRAAWRREWEAGLLSRWDEMERAGGVGLTARLDLLRRASGSIVDAITYRDGRWTMGAMWEDVKFAARGLTRRPGFGAVVVLTLAVGIGANTAIFGVASDVLLRPFPYPDPDRVVSVQTHNPVRPGSGNVAYPNMFDLAEASSTFEAIGVARNWSPALEDDRGSVVIRGGTVTANFFEILGMDAGTGRFFGADEEGEGRPDQIVLSHDFWVDNFGADPTVVGSDLRLSGTPYRVIGVTSAAFEDPWIMGGPGTEPQVWRTVASHLSDWPRGGRSWRGIGRVRSDATLERAEAELTGLFAGLAEAHPESNANRTVRVVPLRALVAGPTRQAILVLLGSVGLLLLVACANLASLLLGRALDRKREMALHRALGASGWRIVQRNLAEAGILAASGGALGVALAMGLAAMSTRLGPMLPRPVTGSVDGLGLLFAAVLTVGTGLLFGIAPALHAARSEAGLSRRDVSGGSTLGRGGHRLRRLLVVGEIALTTALLIGAGLLVRSFQELGSVELGFRTEGVVGMYLHGAGWSGLDPAAAQAQWDDVLEAVRNQPGIEAAGAIDYLPLGGSYSCDGIVPQDRPEPEAGEGMCAEVRVVLPGALPAMGLSLLDGRLISERDGADQPLVAVIDERMADVFWPGENPIGKSFAVHLNVHEVVGIVGDMRHFGPGEEHRPMVYLHAPQEGWSGIARGLSVIASGPDAAAIPAAIRSAVASVNGSIAVGSARSLDALLRTTMAGPRFRTLLMVCFGVTALLLAVLGIAGVMGYSVARRTRELGVRLALGARPAEVRALVLREGGRLIGGGVAVGVLGAAAIAGTLEALLFGVQARDPVVYLAVTGLLVAVASLACLVPARRASRVDPISALSSE